MRNSFHPARTSLAANRIRMTAINTAPYLGGQIVNKENAGKKRMAGIDARSNPHHKRDFRLDALITIAFNERTLLDCQARTAAVLLPRYSILGLGH
jgi:hypothetical protein